MSKVDLRKLVEDIDDFNDWSHTEKVQLFAWYLHTYQNLERLTSTAINDCFNRLNVEKPSSTSVLISNLEKRRPKIVLRDAKGFYLLIAKAVRDDFAERYASITSGVKIVQLLANLPNDIPNLIERGSLNEVLTCFKCGAHRSAIVMAWNLAYVHLCEFVFANHLVTFNLKWPARHPGAHAKSKVKEIAQREHFSELKESEVLEICRSAGIISADLYRLLEQKLGTRNSAAHPSNIVFTQLQAEEFIHSIVSNVVTQLV